MMIMSCSMFITSVMLRDLARPALQAVRLDDQVDGGARSAAASP